MHYFLRRRWQLVKDECSDDAEVATTGAATSAKEIGVMLFIDTTRDYLAICIDRENIYRREPVHGQPMEAREQTISAAADVPASAYRVAGSRGNRHAIALKQIEINVSELLPGINSIPRSIFKCICILQKTEIENCTARIVDDKIFVAVATAADRWTHSGIHNALQGLSYVRWGFAQLDAAGVIRLCRGQAQVPAPSQGLVTRVLLGNGNRHVAPDRRCVN